MALAMASLFCENYFCFLYIFLKSYIFSETSIIFLELHLNQLQEFLICQSNDNFDQGNTAILFDVHFKKDPHLNTVESRLKKICACLYREPYVNQTSF